MYKKTTLIGGVLAATALLPGIASASFLLDTGTPATNPASTYVLSSGQWFAAEFHATAGEDVTSLAAYLTQSSANLGYSFTFDIYNNSGSNSLFPSRGSSLAPLAAFAATFTGPVGGVQGWTSTAVNWTVPTTGDYWLAVQVNASLNQSGNLDLPALAAQSGTAPAEAFAYYQVSGSNGAYKTLGAPAVGLEVSAVPLPAGFWLFASGLLGLGTFASRQRIRHFLHNMTAAATGNQAAA